MASIKNQQKFGNIAGNKNPVPQTGDEVVVHSDSSSINQAVEEGQHEGAKLPRCLNKEQSREVAPNPHMLASMKRLLEEQRNNMDRQLYCELKVRRDQAHHRQCCE